MIKKLVDKYSHFLPTRLTPDGKDNKEGQRKTPCDKKLYKRTTGQLSLASDKPYSSVTGALIYISQMARPDICYAVNLCARYMSDPADTHWEALMQILVYLRESSSLIIRYTRSHNYSNQLLSYSDANWRGCPDTMRSTSGYCVFFNGGPVAWGSKLQPLVADSTQYAEIMGLHKCKNVVVHARQVVSFLERVNINPTIVSYSVQDNKGMTGSQPTVGNKRNYSWDDGVYIESSGRYPTGSENPDMSDAGQLPTNTFVDSFGTIRWSFNPEGDSQRMKHVRTSYHSVREEVEEFHSINPLKISGSDNFADIFTKNLARQPFLRFREGYATEEQYWPGLLANPSLKETVNINMTE
jgi:hypothetical protein